MRRSFLSLLIRKKNEGERKTIWRAENHKEKRKKKKRKGKRDKWHVRRRNEECGRKFPTLIKSVREVKRRRKTGEKGEKKRDSHA